MQSKKKPSDASSCFRPDSLKHCDPYFGASAPSSVAFFEEFGFVPKVPHKEEGEDLLEGHDCQVELTPMPNEFNTFSINQNQNKDDIVFHGNEYVDLCEVYKPSRAEDSLLEVASLGTKRKILEESEKSTIDGQFSALVADALFTPSNAPSSKSVKNDLNIKFKTVKSAANDPCVVPEMRKKRFPGDQYSPKLIRGSGSLREGLCELCHPSVWLKIKQSAYWYHMNFIHGISATTGLPYDPPSSLNERLVHWNDGEQSIELEGFCESCQSWVCVGTKSYAQLGIEELDEQGRFKGNSSWWRHAQKCQSRRCLRRPKRHSI